MSGEQEITEETIKGMILLMWIRLSGVHIGCNKMWSVYLELKYRIQLKLTL
jgi:hypothetical protein